MRSAEGAPAPVVHLPLPIAGSLRRLRAIRAGPARAMRHCALPHHGLAGLRQERVCPPALGFVPVQPVRFAFANLYWLALQKCVSRSGRSSAEISTGARTPPRLRLR